MLANIIRNAKKTVGGGGGGIVTDNGDPFYSAVSLLLPMDGTNGSTTFTDSSLNAATVTVTGDAQISTSQSKYGAAGYFDGTGDYLSIPWNSAYALTGDFTVESWIYPTATPNGSAWIAEQYTGGANTIAWCFGFVDSASAVTTGSKLFFGSYSGSAWSGVLASTGLTLNQWSHVAAVRSGSTLTIYLNGTAVGSGTFSAAISTGDGLYVGRRWDSYVASPFFQGYIDDLRISQFARYTSTFTPPTAALPTTASSTVADPYYGYTSLLLHMDGTNASTNFVDSGPNALTVTAVGNAQISTTQSKYGGASGYFDGTGDYLSISPNTAIDLSSGNFTIEFWIRPAPKTNAVDAAFGYSNYACMFYHNGANWTLEMSSTGFSNQLVISFAVTLNTWQHIAIVRSGTSVVVYKDGVSSASGTFTGTVATSGRTLRIGDNGNSQNINGYIDDLRITKYARYTSAFTPPTQAHPNLYNPYTTLPVSGAALWLDASQQNTIFSDAGTTPVTTSGQSIYQWNDLSGNNRHAVQATSGNRPTWVSPASGQNGLGVTSFNGSSSFFDTSMSLNGLSSFSIFLVAKSATSGGWQSALRQQGASGYFVMPWTSGGTLSPRIILDYDGTTVTTNTVTLTNGAFSLISFIRTSGNSNVANVNGVLSSTRSANTSSLSTSVNLVIGRYAYAAPESFSGSIAEIVIFNRALSVSETASVESYLKTKWGTP